MFSLIYSLRAVPVVGSLLLIGAWAGLIIGFIMNLWKTGSGVLALLNVVPVTTDMLIHTGVRAVSLFIPIVNCIAGYF